MRGCERLALHTSELCAARWGQKRACSAEARCCTQIYSRGMVKWPARAAWRHRSAMKIPRWPPPWSRRGGAGGVNTFSPRARGAARPYTKDPRKKFFACNCACNTDINWTANTRLSLHSDRCRGIVYGATAHNVSVAERRSRAPQVITRPRGGLLSPPRRSSPDVCDTAPTRPPALVSSPHTGHGYSFPDRHLHGSECTHKVG